MHTVIARRFVLSVGLFVPTLIGLGEFAAPPCSAAETQAEPKVDPRLKALVDRHLRSNPDYMPGDILARGDIEPIFNELIELGIQPVDNSEELYDSILTDGQYLVEVLRTPQGRAFMREVAKLPHAYDRLERFSWIPAGREWLDHLVEAEDGSKLFAQLMTDEGLKVVEAKLGNDSRGRNIRLPTGHIYTETQLLARLQRALTAQARRDAAERKSATPAEKPSR